MTTQVSATPHLVRVLRAGFAVYGLAALVYIPVRDADSLELVNYLSYFTIESNVLAAVVLLIGAIRDPQSKGWQMVRGAVTVYMVITGIVYATLLADVDVRLNDAWINTALHRVLPLVLLVDWILMPARHRVPLARTLMWLSFPLAYGVYSLIRGSIVDWYPYPFLDPRDSDYATVTVGLAGLLVTMAVMAVLVVLAGRLGARLRFGDHRGRIDPVR